MGCGEKYGKGKQFRSQSHEEADGSRLALSQCLELRCTRPNFQSGVIKEKRRTLKISCGNKIQEKAAVSQPESYRNNGTY